VGAPLMIALVEASCGSPAEYHPHEAGLGGMSGNNGDAGLDVARDAPVEKEEPGGGGAAGPAPAAGGTPTGGSSAVGGIAGPGGSSVGGTAGTSAPSPTGGIGGTPGFGGSAGAAGGAGKGGETGSASGGIGGASSGCSKDQLMCGGRGINPASSSAHCGGCGNACATAEICSAGRCLLRDGESCAAPSSCSSGICTNFFRDEDGDGHGAISSSTGRCTITTPPPGFVTVGDDCCDNGGNLLAAAKIHPGAGFQTASAGGLCGITWDFDCSGRIELGPDFDANTYCPYACADTICKSSTCVEQPLKADPGASLKCGSLLGSCAYSYSGFPTAICMTFQTGPGTGAVFTCK
jgi:hypothetical protein